MFISFGHLTRKSLLFLGVPITTVIHMVLISLSQNKNRIFFNGSIEFLGKLINGILWLLFEKRISSIKIEKLDSKDNKDMKFVTADQNIPPQQNPDILNEDKLEKKCSIYNEYELDCYKKKKSEKKRNCKILCLLMLVCVLDFVYITCHSIMVKIGVYENTSGSLLLSSLLIRLSTIAVLSKLIIKNTKIYSHHFLSIIIIAIVTIAINVFSYIKEKNYNLVNLLKMALPDLLNSIIYVLGAKYLLLTKGNIYKLLFIDGIIGIILSILLQVVVNFIPCSSVKNIFYETCDKSIIESFGFEEFITRYSIPLVLIIFFETWLSWLLIYYFSVNHFCAICSIQLFSVCIIQQQNLIVYIIGCVSIAFMALVYNEIIILRFCGLDTNTAIEIYKRALIDSNCDFGKDDDEIFTQSNDNYIIMKEDIGEVND